MRKLFFVLMMLIAYISYGMAQISVTGTVTGADGVPVPGVTVVVQGTTVGTTTNADGQYSINVPEGQDILEFSFVGMTTQRVSIDGRTTVNVTMVDDFIALEEIVAVGYGVQRRGDITGAISSVSSRDIMELPSMDAGSVLQGRAAGVMALSSGTRPGEGVTIRIRGRRSLTADNNPLYVVDGIPYEGNINDINTRDIQSIEVLKDASATAIYGSRGANGVILITTNRGGNFPTIVSYNGYYGISSALGRPDMMNGEQYARMKEVGGRAFTGAELDAIQRGVSTDWVDLTLDNGYQQSHQLGVSGGDSRTGFSLSANLFNDKGVVRNQDFTRKTLRLNLDHTVSDRVRVGTSTQVSDQLQNWGSNPFNQAVNASPLAEPYDSEGNMVYQPGADPLRWNPLADLVDGAYVDERERLRVFSNLFAEADITENLSYRMNFGSDYQRYNRGLFQGSLSSGRQYASPRALKENIENYTYTFENIVNYSFELNENHRLRATGLFSIQESSTEEGLIDVEGLPYEHQLFHNLSTAETVRSFNSNLEEWGIMSFMGRINYDIMGKYLFTLTGRYDGSSRLSDENRWGFFPSAAFLWRISSEEFMANQNIFSDLRFRASYGVTGNTGIDPYQTRGGLNRSVYSFGGSSAFGYRPGTIANPELKWESSATYNIGLDFGIGTNIAGSFEVYQTNTTDLLLERNIPITSGFNSVMENIGETQNRGWELSLSGRLLTSTDFSWDANLNFFGNREKIIDLYGDKQDDIGSGWFIGEPLTVYYDYEKIGIWQLGEEAEAAAYQMTPGTIKIRDINGDGIINQDDRVILGTNMPFATVGLGSRMTFRNFDFSFFLISIFGHTIYNNYEVGLSTLQGRYNNLNVDYWTPENPTNDHPIPDGSRESPLYNSSRGYQSGDFLKVRNMQLGYSLPQSMLSRIGARSMKIYINADTPFIFSHLANNLDPEIYSGTVSSDTPSTRMYSLGLNIDF
jgi:TonB-linked SusC/RagA family outer membrane protein